MNTTHFIIFISIVQLIFILTDIYVLRNWKKFVLTKQWNNNWYKIPYYVSVIAVAINMFVNIRRMDMGAIPRFEMFLYDSVVLWYLPKLPIMLVLLSGDIVRLFVKIKTLISKFFRKSPETPLEHTTAVGMPRRELLKNVGWTLAASPFIIVGDGLVRKVTNFTVRNVELPIKDLPNALVGLTIAQISDLHAGSIPDGDHMNEVRNIIRSKKPDMVFMTGDFVNFRSQEFPLIADDIVKIKAPLGVYACLGNHDHYSEYSDHVQLKEMIRQAGVDLLVNANRVLSIDGAKLQIAGTDNTGLRQSFGRLDKALTGLTPENPTLLLHHDPTFWDISVKEKSFVDAMFSGHTHGGQIGMHILGAEMSVAQVVYKQWAGLYSENNQHLYVNRGVGVVGPALRIGIDPEITIFTLKKA